MKDIDELLDVELKLKEIKKGKVVSIVKDTNVPCFPFDEPREYQKLAFESWKKINRKVFSLWLQGLVRLLPL